MAKELSFKNLPFVPVGGQVIYVEQSYNEKLNTYIRKNYDRLKTLFFSQGLDFCYLPLLAKEIISYNAPYLNEKDICSKTEQVPSLANYLADDSLDCPSLVFGLDVPVKDENGNIKLQVVPIKTKWYTSTKSTFKNLAKEVKQISQLQSRKYRETEQQHKPQEVAPSLHDEEDNFVRFSIRHPQDADDSFDAQSQLLVEGIRQRIDALRNRGVNTMFLHELIDEGEKLSRLRITKDYRIFLIDYNNIEIKMPVLPKSVFFLFLRHPEGIRFKELTDYYSELLQIYLQMNPIGSRLKQEQSIRDITDPCNNSINEKCARIREAFITKFDERLAKNYYITGNRGEVKRITLDKSLILWEK
jgi:hypothetical protein